MIADRISALRKARCVFYNICMCVMCVCYVCVLCVYYVCVMCVCVRVCVCVLLCHVSCRCMDVDRYEHILSM